MKGLVSVIIFYAGSETLLYRKKLLFLTIHSSNSLYTVMIRFSALLQISAPF